jgi:hypothetical protein
VTGQLDGQEIYENFQKGPGPDGLTMSAEIVKAVATGYQHLADHVHGLALEMEAAWEGDAGDGARRGARPMIAEHELAAHELLTAEDLVNRQVDSFLEAKNRVVPVPPAPSEVVPWQPASPAEDITSILRQAGAHHAAAQNNVDVMNGYTGASDHNTVHLPMTYGTLTSADVTLGQAGLFLGGAPEQDREAAGTTDPGAAAAPRAGVDERHGRPGQPGAAPAPGMVAPNGAGSEVGTPVVIQRGTAGVPTGAASGPDGPDPSHGSGPRQGVGPPTTHGGEPPGGTAAHATTGGVEQRGIRGASGARGARGDTEPLRGESRAPRLVAEARTEPARSAPLGGVPVGTPPGRDEDTEHPVPAYLKERDPEELFGCDEVVAPETLGLDEE